MKSFEPLTFSVLRSFGCSDTALAICPVGSDECDYGDPNRTGVHAGAGVERCVATRVLDGAAVARWVGVFAHAVEARTGGGAWGCDAETGARTGDDRAITFAGVSGDIAGCMAWGHRPRLGDALADAHAACILMKRAAFCGEDSDTIDGTRIFVADAFGTQGDPHDRLEAAWGPEGAVCIEPANLRHPELGLPACAAALPRCSTGDVFALGAVASARP